MALVRRFTHPPVVIPEPVIVKELSKTIVRRPIPKRAPIIKSVLEPIKALVADDIILAKINQRQRQIILHSVLYYRMNTNLITDLTFDTWSRELVKLQADYPELAKTSIFYEDMKDFDGTTGYHLADNLWGISKATQTLVVWNSLKGTI